MRKVLITIPTKMLEATDSLVKEGFYASRSEAIRAGLRLLFESQGARSEEHSGDLMEFLGAMEGPRDFSYS